MGSDASSVGAPFTIDVGAERPEVTGAHGYDPDARPSPSSLGVPDAMHARGLAEDRAVRARLRASLWLEFHPKCSVPKCCRGLVAASRTNCRFRGCARCKCLSGDGKRHSAGEKCPIASVEGTSEPTYERIVVASDVRERHPGARLQRGVSRPD